jgi:hypothetical protein
VGWNRQKCWKRKESKKGKSDTYGSFLDIVSICSWNLLKYGFLNSCWIIGFSIKSITSYIQKDEERK